MPPNRWRVRRTQPCVRQRNLTVLMIGERVASSRAALRESINE